MSCIRDERKSQIPIMTFFAIKNVIVVVLCEYVPSLRKNRPTSCYLFMNTV